MMRPKPFAANQGAAKSGRMMATNRWLRNGSAALLVFIASGCSSPAPHKDHAREREPAGAAATPSSRDVSGKRAESALAARDGPLIEAKQVALLLPLSGKLAAFGAAVRDGFMASWYEARERGANPPVIRLYDTSATPDFNQLYQQAVADGAAVVIGPLEKPQVAQLYQQNLPVPTLALNRADIEQSAPTANLYQFSLAPEDEATQIADIAFQENHRHAMVIAPEEEWRGREMQVFTQRWQQRGGEITTSVRYYDAQSLSQSIRAALNIPQSEARAKELEGIINRNVEFTPQRRRDVDMVFMLAKPQQARSIKPTLAYYYAGDVPVYTLSRIYNGAPNPSLDRDMDSVKFTEMPWILENSPLKQRILADQPQSGNFLRLYAMGIDSFRLYPHLRQMEVNTGSHIPGQTGNLTLNPQRVIQRQLLLAQMRDGKPEQVPSAATQEAAPSLATESPIDTEIRP